MMEFSPGRMKPDNTMTHVCLIRWEYSDRMSSGRQSGSSWKVCCCEASLWTLHSGRKLYSCKCFITCYEEFCDIDRKRPLNGDLGWSIFYLTALNA